MGAAAEFHGNAGKVDDSDFRAVFFTEHGYCALGFGFGDGHCGDFRVLCLGDPGVDLVFDLLQFGGSDGTGTVEVEPEAIETDEGTGLTDTGIDDRFEGGLE